MRTPSPKLKRTVQGPMARPIIFSGEMVKAILDSRKTQTRRIAKARGADRVLYVEGAPLYPARNGDTGYTGWVAEVDKLGGRNGLHLPITCPYGAAGGKLWVRETWSPYGENAAWYRADFNGRLTQPGLKGGGGHFTGWKPSIHMPRWASRITLEITKVRVERLQDISEEDAKAEGVEPVGYLAVNPFLTRALHALMSREKNTHRTEYRLLWDSLHGKGAWEKNPWVWILEFKRHLFEHGTKSDEGSRLSQTGRGILD